MLRDPDMALAVEKVLKQMMNETQNQTYED